MVAAIVSLHERFGAGQGYLGVEPPTIGIVGMAEEQVSDVRGPHLPKGLGPQALGDSQFEGLRRVLNDLTC